MNEKNQNRFNFDFSEIIANAEKVKEWKEKQKQKEKQKRTEQIIAAKRARLFDEIEQITGERPENLTAAKCLAFGWNFEIDTKNYKIKK